ncbi:MAG: hypothetical protein K8I02_10550 [Candidatus Methylomirabilis sp.]|nr:hypothetical protein [Deltaproteobacteria bacterium]
MSRLGRLAAILSAALAAAGCPPGPPPCPSAPVQIPEFVFGQSQGGPQQAAFVEEAGFRYLRMTMSWVSLEAAVSHPTLTRAEVDADPSLVDDFTASANWAGLDAALAEIASRGLKPIALVGHGYKGTLPSHNGARITPDSLGKANYIGNQYLVTRAVVRRYASQVDFWQTENELNQAMLTTLFGWREPAGIDGLTSAWGDWTFLTELLAALRDAVKAEDPTAATTMNFHTDINPALNQFINTPTWPDSIGRWRQYMDVVSFDAYPNYYASSPVRGEVVGERTAEVRVLACESQQVMIMETGYPTGPSVRGYDEAGQAAYIQEAYDTSVAAGAEGFVYFGIKTADTHTVDITQEDLDNLALIGEAYETGDWATLLGFVLADPEYLQGHFNEVLQSVEPYWGLVRPDLSHKPGFATVQSIAASLP